MIGYITVLPGAFSVYRFQALQPNNIKGPLWKDYFKPLMKPWKMNCYNSNIYLAEDRVLCFCLFTAEGKRNLLKYVRKAVAYTDPPPTYDALISQRRRWFNGSFFCLFNTLLKSHKIFWTAHNPLRKIFFLLQMLYYLLNLIFSLIIVSFFLIAVNSCIHILFSNSNVQISSLLTFYIILLGIILILSLGSDVKNMKNFFQVISTFLSIYMFFVMVLLVQMIYDSLYSKDLILPIILTFFSFFIIIVLNKELCNVSIGIIQFLFVTPVFLNIFTIYSICNIHDVSWGNRTSEMNKREKVLILDFEKYRTYCLLFWLFINSVFLFFFGDADGKSANYFYYIGTVGMGLIYVRFVGGIAHLVKQKCCKYTFIERIRKSDEDFTDKNTISYIS